MFENPRTRQASKEFYHKCSRSQIVFRTDMFRKLTLGAPEPYISGKVMIDSIAFYLFIEAEISESIFYLPFTPLGKMSGSACHCDPETEYCRNRKCVCKRDYKRNTQGDCILPPGKLYSTIT